ncbi:DUF1232 domain-containing protein [Frankia sp. CNm7]|uniref:DUF1232 domain-containing protein n=1 Tax=Frankia nepalensis TaxID=1836974 RepID=A0A937RHB4_9ACTN|nr:YkvA family protein [Frankia nepalensis]MBL7497940.1 DUF1232 domain-containing protein [Frankia nepalensis]MBL7512168.1 DUF1232 domain-containing protein [Frankia nepalensis]MBL7520080.1 DUF1232 domain-containing protein [Frankia nepalensis]MBL7630380.1 DUF1232 domain-containing protein [Frankia nepalensis]
MATLDKDALRSFGREVATFLPDTAFMLRGVVADPRVPQSAKLEAGAALAYLVSPKNKITNVIPVIGQLDDVAVIAFAFRRLVVGAGEPILREHWRGSDRAFHALIGASSALASPAGMVRKAKLATTIAGAAFGRVGGVGRFGGSGRVVDGEVVGRVDETIPGGPAAGNSAKGDTAGGNSGGKGDGGWFRK